MAVSASGGNSSNAEPSSPTPAGPPVALLDYAGAAAYLAVSERTLRLLVAEGAISHRRIGRLVRFTQADLDEYLASVKVEASS